MVPICYSTYLYSDLICVVSPVSSHGIARQSGEQCCWRLLTYPCRTALPLLWPIDVANMHGRYAKQLRLQEMYVWAICSF